jgi:hypothetical protein
LADIDHLAIAHEHVHARPTIREIEGPRNGTPREQSYARKQVFKHNRSSFRATEPIPPRSWGSLLRFKEDGAPRYWVHLLRPDGGSIVFDEVQPGILQVGPLQIGVPEIGIRTDRIAQVSLAQVGAL